VYVGGMRASEPALPPTFSRSSSDTRTLDCSCDPVYEVEGETSVNSITVRVLRDVEDRVEVGSEGCACGGCRPTATIYREDPTYQRHDPKLAEGPCCCGRFFVVGNDASKADKHAQEMTGQINATRRRPHHYRFERRQLTVPWGESFAVVVADLVP
jgi:hypothetical protein